MPVTRSGGKAAIKHTREVSRDSSVLHDCSLLDVLQAVLLRQVVLHKWPN